MSNTLIYLDNMASTPVDPAVVSVMQEALADDQLCGNPSAVWHESAKTVNGLIDDAQGRLAAVLGCQASEIIWTSGATESNNLALKGAARFYRRQGMHIITMASEHSSVLGSCAQLEREGFDVTYLKPDREGLLSLSALQAAWRPDTILVSIMHVNNETGVIQDIQALGDWVKQQGAVMHVDGTQSFGKLPLSLSQMPAC
jgi:cysteine desulfurase